MKQFMLSSFSEFNGLYEVWFGNRLCVRFASKRDTAGFLADTNRFLTSSMVELNEFYILIFKEYRNIWFTLMNFKNGTPVNRAQDERDLQRLVADIADQFNRCGNTAHGTASGAWSFIHLQNICLMEAEILQKLIALNKARNNTYQYHSLQTLYNRIKELEQKICNYPEELPPNAVEMKSNK